MHTEREITALNPTLGLSIKTSEAITPGIFIGITPDQSCEPAVQTGNRFGFPAAVDSVATCAAP